MKLLIAGGSGFIGSFLYDFLKDKGHVVTVLTRSIEKVRHNHNVLQWDGRLLETDQQFDVIINLCGANIASKRWSNATKQALLESRLLPTQAIVSFIESCAPQAKPKLINASAVGFYSSSRQAQTEDCYVVATNKLFSQALVMQWEQCARQAAASGAVVTALRFGVVLGSRGGMLKKIMPSFKVGLGAVMGNSEAYLSWVHIKDLCRAIDFVMCLDHMECVYNVTAPHSCTQRALAKALASVCNKPCLIRMPSFLIKIIFGQMGDELILSDQKIVPRNLLEAGFKFEYEDIQAAIKDLF